MNISDDRVFEQAEFLEAHIKSILDFYAPRIFSPEGGFYGCFLDDGTCYDPQSRQLVGSARYVVNYATAYRRYGRKKHLDWAKWGLNYLVNYHKQAEGYYAWLLKDDDVTDSRVMAYGQAFVILAAAACHEIGIKNADKILNDAFKFMETYFWDDAAQAYCDERDQTLKLLSPYRGQNANMHMCEALLAAWQATQDIKFLDRAEVLAHRFTFELAEQSEGQVWEHYTEDWTVDMTYNIDRPNDRYKPWGFQPGHQLEWSKLLLILNNERPQKKWLTKAISLYDMAMQTGWDKEFGGLVYGVAPQGEYCATEKYFWVQAEAFAAAWRLYSMTGQETYREDYNRIWRWSWDNLIDHHYGAWFRVRNRDGSAIDNKKSPLGKTDYHTLGACWDVLSVLG